MRQIYPILRKPPKILSKKYSLLFTDIHLLMYYEKIIMLQINKKNIINATEMYVYKYLFCIFVEN